MKVNQFLGDSMHRMQTGHVTGSGLVKSTLSRSVIRRVACKICRADSEELRLTLAVTAQPRYTPHADLVSTVSSRSPMDVSLTHSLLNYT